MNSPIKPHLKLIGQANWQCADASVPTAIPKAAATERMNYSKAAPRQTGTLMSRPAYTPSIALRMNAARGAATPEPISISSNKGTSTL